MEQLFKTAMSYHADANAVDNQVNIEMKLGDGR